MGSRKGFLYPRMCPRFLIFYETLRVPYLSTLFASITKEHKYIQLIEFSNYSYASTTYVECPVCFKYGPSGQPCANCGHGL